MTLANLVLSGARAVAPVGKVPITANIIEFVEEPWGLGMQLFPIQKIILKAHYGLPLDDTQTFTVTDWRRQNARQMTEKEYLAYLYSEGRSNIKEVVLGHERREMILSIGRRSGKCVTGDTLVLTNRGIYPIAELGDPNGPEVQPLAVTVAQEGVGSSTSRYFYNGGTKPTYRITSHTGVTVEGTGNHRVRVMTPGGTVEWRRLDEMRPGDVLAVHRTSSLWASDLVDVRPYHVRAARRAAAVQPDTFEERWGLLMGYLVGDGSWTSRTSLAITVEHPETRAEVESLFTDLCRVPSFTHDKRTTRTGAVRVHDKALREFLHRLGFDWGCEAHTKRTPWVVMRSPRPVVRAYLQGLFETDGTVTSGGKTVSFCSASRDLARETQVLLLNFGVVSRLRVKHNRKLNRDYYEVTIRGLRSRRTFASEIGFRSRKKQGPLEAGLVSPSREGGDSESVPHQTEWATRLLASVPKALPGRGWQRSTLRAVLGNVCKPGSGDDLTYDRIRALLPVAESLGADPAVIAHFRDLLRTDYFFDPVVTVTPGEARVYDLNVPEGESFVANGLTNHNTTISACIAAFETYKLISKGDPQAYYGLPQSNMIQLISVATDKDQAGLLYQEVSGHFRNCFAYETEIITSDGIKPIGALAGTTQTLLGRDGSWVEAPIRSFGRQQLYKLVLSRQGIDKEVYVTANHRWFAKDARKPHRGQGYREFTTVELRPGKHRLQYVFGRSYKNTVTPSPFGIAHGFTFGDGGTTKGQRNANTVTMIGEKDSNLRPYFALCPQRERADINGVQASALPNFFRQLPSIRENKSYLLGWLMGYFAADGSCSNGQVRISSVDRRNVEFVRDVCAVIGIGTYAIREETRASNLTGRPHTMFHVGLMRNTLDESFFLIPEHRSDFVANGADSVGLRYWTVKSVEPTDRVEEVYCATVEGQHAFALEGNIVTGNCAFFGPYTANNTMSYARFQTPKDVERYGAYADDPSAKATIKVTFRSCVAKGLRGAGNIVVILDEVAHFTDAGQSSADAVYNAVVPSTSAYSPKDPLDRRKPIGDVEGRIILISSPLGRQGLFYKMFQIGMSGGMAASNMLCIQAPTWEVNPTVPAHEFEKHYLKDQAVFFTEYGGEFSDRTRGWIERGEDLAACVDKTARPQQRGAHRTPYFLGLDLGLVGDGTAVSIGHLDPEGRIVVDLVDQIKAGDGKYHTKERLDFDDVADWILDLSKRFYIQEGMFDQWAGIPLEQALSKRGLGQMKAQQMTKQLTSQMFQNFKDMMWDKKLVLYDHPIPPNESHCPYIAELLELQAQYHSKFVTTVEAPNIDGKHDDMSDALVRMVWLASNRLAKSVHLSGAQRQNGPVIPGYARMAMRAKLLQSGSHESRQVPRHGAGGVKRWVSR